MDSPEISSRFSFIEGGEGRVLALRGDAITLDSSVPSPPGSRREAELEGASLRFKVKVHASRRQASGRFVLEGRLFDATKAVIDALTRGAQAGATAG